MEVEFRSLTAWGENLCCDLCIKRVRCMQTHLRNLFCIPKFISCLSCAYGQGHNTTFSLLAWKPFLQSHELSPLILIKLPLKPLPAPKKTDSIHLFFFFFCRCSKWLMEWIKKNKGTQMTEVIESFWFPMQGKLKKFYLWLMVPLHIENVSCLVGHSRK